MNEGNLPGENGKKFSKILVAVDGSEASMDAADYATELARKYNSELIALHVILADVTLLGPNPPRHIEQLKTQAQEYLDKVKQKSNLNNDDDYNENDGSNGLKIRVRTESIASASSVGGIVGFAEKENIDLIVIGTRGRSGFKKLLLGSVASGVVNYAHCPVMVLK
jgi:nucleotide-binding universal stress UspA family protein